MLTDLDGLSRIKGVVDLGAYENRYTGCQDSLMLTNLYSPLQGDYQAKTQISLENGAFISNSHIVTISAPQVLIQNAFMTEIGSLFTVNQTGCN